MSDLTHEHDMVVFQLGFAVGLMAEYLPSNFIELAAIDDESGSLHDAEAFASARDEGEADRAGYTAEELFVWAHEWQRDGNQAVLP